MSCSILHWGPHTESWVNLSWKKLVLTTKLIYVSSLKALLIITATFLVNGRSTIEGQKCQHGHPVVQDDQRQPLLFCFHLDRENSDQARFLDHSNSWIRAAGSLNCLVVMAITMVRRFVHRPHSNERRCSVSYIWKQRTAYITKTVKGLKQSLGVPQRREGPQKKKIHQVGQSKFCLTKMIKAT